MKKKILFWFVILTMMGSTQARAFYGFVYLSTDADQGLHVAQFFSQNNGPGVTINLWCSDLQTGYSIAYATNFQPLDAGVIMEKIDEICNEHNNYFRIYEPSRPQIYYYSFIMIVNN